MNNGSRIKRSLLNARINTFCYFASLFVAFFTRKILLDYLGAEFIGLTSTFQSLLGFLNLAELGVATAVGYVLYKPIFDGNKEKICEIITVLGYVYSKIGFFVLTCGIILSFFLPVLFPETNFSWTVIYLGFYAFLACSMFGYFVNYKMNLLAADQRNYIITGYYQLSWNIKIIVQMILAYLVHSFILYFLIELSTATVNSIIINRKVKETYPWLKCRMSEGRSLINKYPEISKYVKQLFVHKIGGFTQLQLTPLLIYSYVSLPVVTLYTNYTIVTQRISGLISGLLDSSMSAGVGNLISEGNQVKIYKTFRGLLAFRFYAIGIVSSCLYLLINPFLDVWLGDNYSLSDTIVILVIVQFVLTSLRGTTDQFLFGYGLFSDVWAPIVEALIFISSSMICGNIWGLSGVLMGPVISLFLIVHLWKPFFLFSKGLKMPYRKYLFLISFYLLLAVFSYLIGFIIISSIIESVNIGIGWLGWILLSLIIASIFFVVYSLIFFSFSADYRSTFTTLINSLHNK